MFLIKIIINEALHLNLLFKLNAMKFLEVNIRYDKNSNKCFLCHPLPVDLFCYLVKVKALSLTIFRIKILEIYIFMEHHNKKVRTTWDDDDR